VFRIACLATLLGALPLGAQQTIYVAPTRNTVRASSEQGMGPTPGHAFYVTNTSSVPVIVFGVTTHSCENVTPWCGGRRINVRIEPGQRRSVGGVEPKDPERSWTYRWSFSYRADSADARFIAALRESGMVAEGDATPLPPQASIRVIDTTSPPGIEQPLSREPLTEAERSGGVSVRPEGEGGGPPRSFRFKVHYGSILGSTMMAGAPVQPTGPCIDPAASARLERDARIARAPWRPPVVPTGFGRSSFTAVRAGGAPPPELLVRWAVDTAGATIPESVRILESSDGQLSAKSCTQVISGRVTPARDKGGRPIRAWVQMPLRAQ